MEEGTQEFQPARVKWVPGFHSHVNLLWFGGGAMQHWATMFFRPQPGPRGSECPGAQKEQCSVHGGLADSAMVG